MFNQRHVEPYSGNLDPLPLDVRNGMIAMGVIGAISTASTFALLVFITYRMLFWRKYYLRPVATNQIFVLIYNLLLADLQQAVSFLIAFHWIAKNKLVGPSPICFAQGWLIQIGDLSSGLWVLAIAIHTFINLVLQKTIPFSMFVVAVVLVWLFCVILTIIGPITHHKNFFVPAGAWCWIGEHHETERLSLHYLWIFVSQLGSLVIYISIFFSLRTRLAQTSRSQPRVSENSSGLQSQSFHKSTATGTTTIVTGQSQSEHFAVSKQRILRTARYMVVYPFAYVVLTLPLAAGRVAAMTGRRPSLVYLCVAGAMMASSGIVDVVLYIYTRKALVRSNVGMKNPTATTINTPLSPYPRGNALKNNETWNDEWNSAEEGRNTRMPSTNTESTTHRENMGEGQIVVSRSVTRVEDDYNSKPGKAESLRSLVDRDRDDDEAPRKKSWPI
ncbi:hypothetical protein HYFRA_00010885 [Hymenoscyphus fraxineus]|uniref:G-protein coupled receptors family 2 profile 2 domain-containing protein n=1 Tax=Hymenoscyphus fraxineus TaxID=746836 RepID=A0A9N9KU31_9HELO|nr:hypothetical protein HYFRA_00010885 [Hymenoscyphus fraxineus]